MSKLTIKPKHTPTQKTAKEVKKLAEYFAIPSCSSPRDKLSMDWSEDIPEVQFSPAPHVSPAGEHVSSPHVPSHNKDSINKRRVESNNSSPSILNYGNNQPAIASFWDGAPHALSIFGTKETSTTDAANMSQSII